MHKVAKNEMDGLEKQIREGQQTGQVETKRRSETT